MNPGGGAGWDDSPLDIQVPDDARELDRDVIAYHRELRAKRRRNRLRRLAAPLRGSGTIMPLLASILAVCLVAGAMLSVATLSPANGSRHEVPSTPRPTTASSTAAPQPPQGPRPRRPRRRGILDRDAHADRTDGGNGPGRRSKNRLASAGHWGSRERPGRQRPGTTRIGRRRPAVDPASARRAATATIFTVHDGVNRGGRQGDPLDPPPALRRRSRAGPGARRMRGRPDAPTQDFHPAAFGA